MRRFLIRMLAVGGAVFGALILTGRDISTRRALRRVDGKAAQRARYLRGVVRGAWYRIRGRRPDPAVSSDALRALVQAAQDAGAAKGTAPLAVRAVLGAFTDRIPDGEPEQLLSHLPLDARDLAGPPRRGGVPSRLRTLVLEEAADVAAVLPDDLRALWSNAVPA